MNFDVNLIESAILNVYFILSSQSLLCLVKPVCKLFAILLRSKYLFLTG